MGGLVNMAIQQALSQRIHFEIGANPCSDTQTEPRIRSLRYSRRAMQKPVTAKEKGSLRYLLVAVPIDMTRQLFHIGLDILDRLPNRLNPLRVLIADFAAEFFFKSHD